MLEIQDKKNKFYFVVYIVFCFTIHINHNGILVIW